MHRPAAQEPERHFKKSLQLNTTGPTSTQLEDSIQSDKGNLPRLNLKILTLKLSTLLNNLNSDHENHGNLVQRYAVHKRMAIGKGGFSKVKLAHKWDRSDEKLYAMKEFRKRRKDESEKGYVRSITSEYCISAGFGHINIVESIDLFQDNNQRWYQVMEFCPGGDLHHAISKGGMSQSEVQCCFKQILEGVRYLHSIGVAHRDIKPENLFFDINSRLKIGDYGLSTVFRLPWTRKEEVSEGLCGTGPYIAPEQFLKQSYNAQLIDIWACGVVYYFLQLRKLPWGVAQVGSDTSYSAYATACADPDPTVSTCPPPINDLDPSSLIRRMLEPDPKLRWTAEEVIAHPWVQSIRTCHGVKDADHVHTCAQTMKNTYRRKHSMGLGTVLYTQR